VRRHDKVSDPDDIRAWLNGGDDALVAAAQPAKGLTLSIARDGGFSEERTGAAAVPWFDADGVLEHQAVPFAGTATPVGEMLYLRLVETKSWATPTEGRYAPALLRYDDEDTKVSDALTLAGDRLVRTMNVVTDELYLNRVVLLYAR
jgi:hypothetical protein